MDYKIYFKMQMPLKKEKLFEVLSLLISNDKELYILAQNAYECGKKNHDKTAMKKMLEMDLRKLCEG